MSKAALQVVTGGEDRDQRPTVQIIAGQMAVNVTRVEELLAEGKAPLYVRGAALVRPVEEKQKASKGEPTSVVALHRVDKFYLRDMMNKMIHFERFDLRKNDWVTANAPMDFSDTVLARKGEWLFRVVAGVINAPTLRDDGSVLSAPGYDDHTGLILHSALKLPPMPQKPTMADAKASLELLKGLLEEFPFVAAKGETLEGNAALSVALSMLITPTVRGCMDTAPMHTVTAPTAGTGKSMLANLAAAIALGERCSVMSINTNDEETEKRLGARAMAGNPIISIDNVNGELGGDTLCQLISESTVEVRVLGLSDMVKVPNRFCIFANGNNLRLKGDVTRRAISCRLDAGMPRPSEREFDGNPFETIMADRGRYVAACLTIVRAYFVAGRPTQTINGAPLVPLNSFEGWSRTVRSALVWLGCADPVATVAAAQADDPELQAIAAFVAAMKTELGADNEFTAAQLIEKYDATGSFPDHNKPRFPMLRRAIDDAPIGRPTGRSLGRWLSKITDRPIEDQADEDQGGMLPEVAAIKSRNARGGIAVYSVKVAR